MNVEPDRLHELRTITSALVNGVELLTDHVDEVPEHVRSLIDQIASDAERLLMKVREL